MEKTKKFFARHWVDILVIAALAAIIVLIAANVYKEFRFAKKWDIFLMMKQKTCLKP